MAGEWPGGEEQELSDGVGSWANGSGEKDTQCGAGSRRARQGRANVPSWRRKGGGATRCVKESGGEEAGQHRRDCNKEDRGRVRKNWNRPRTAGQPSRSGGQESGRNEAPDKSGRAGEQFEHNTHGQQLGSGRTEEGRKDAGEAVKMEA